MTFEREDVSNKNSTIAFVLCLFFGSLGLHQFYVGKKIKGLIYCLFGIPWITSIIIGKIGNEISGIPGVFKGVLISIFLSVLVAVAILYDLFSLYSDSFTDKKGKILISNSQKDEMFGRSPEERFNDRLNGVIAFLCCIIVLIIDFVFISIAL